MKIRRRVLAPVILALAAAGSIAFGSAVPAIAAQAPAAHVLAAAPNSYYHE